MSDTLDPLKIQKEKVFDYVKAFLGDGMVDVELDPKHYEIALEKSLAIYRQRSPNSVEESYCFLDLVQDQNEYSYQKKLYRSEKYSVEVLDHAQAAAMAERYLNRST